MTPPTTMAQWGGVDGGWSAKGPPAISSAHLAGETWSNGTSRCTKGGRWALKETRSRQNQAGEHEN